jgi:hypothetical protein
MLKILLVVVTCFITLAAFSARHVQGPENKASIESGYSPSNVKLVKKLLTE